MKKRIVSLVLVLTFVVVSGASVFAAECRPADRPWPPTPPIIPSPTFSPIIDLDLNDIN